MLNSPSAVAGHVFGSVGAASRAHGHTSDMSRLAWSFLGSPKHTAMQPLGIIANLVTSHGCDPSPGYSCLQHRHSPLNIQQNLLEYVQDIMRSLSVACLIYSKSLHMKTAKHTSVVIDYITLTYPAKLGKLPTCYLAQQCPLLEGNGIEPPIITTYIFPVPPTGSP